MAGSPSKLIKNLEIHLFWIIVILVLSVISLIVYEPSGQIIQNYVSFAAAIASILLALIAIIFSFLSNQTFSETVGDLKGSVEESGNASNDIVTASRALQEAVEKIQNDFSGIGPTVEKISQRMEEYSSPSVAQSDSKPDDANVSPDLFRDITTPGIDGCLLIFLLAEEKGRTEVSFEKMFNVDERDWVRQWGIYCSAVASTMQATQPCNIKIGNRVENGEQGTYSATFFQITDWGAIDKDLLKRYVLAKNTISAEIRVLIDRYLSE